MKIGIASHIVKDSIIDTEGNEIESLGGPACYGSIIAKTFKLDSYLFTKVGIDILKDLEFLKENGILIKKDKQIDEKSQTTRFQLILNKDGDRKMRLLTRCSHIEMNSTDTDNLDGIILSPILDEIPNELFDSITKTMKDKFIILDPQGFLRIWNKETLQILYKQYVDLELRGLSAIKTDEQELLALTNGIGSIEGMKLLKNKYNLEFVITTGFNQISLLNKNIVYSLSFKKIPTQDNTGLGDILTSAFSCAYLKEKDPLWALCFGAGAVVSSLNTNKKGLEKIPRKMNLIERNASYFYNTIKFKIID
ncbi:MAG: PfkB family carbohydrate kinase [Candidatus Nitrosocosmicus sp.]